MPELSASNLRMTEKNSRPSFRISSDEYMNEPDSGVDRLYGEMPALSPYVDKYSDGHANHEPGDQIMSSALPDNCTITSPDHGFSEPHSSATVATLPINCNY